MWKINCARLDIVEHGVCKQSQIEYEFVYDRAVDDHAETRAGFKR